MSFYQARRCELGLGVRCHCRCGQSLHGAKRFGDDPSFADFSKLPASDPHHVPYTLRNELRFGSRQLPSPPPEESAHARH